MPVTSEAQRRASGTPTVLPLPIAAHGRGTLDIPPAVAREYLRAPHAKRLRERAKKVAHGLRRTPH